MTDIQITRYDTTFKKEWDDFVSNSKNATFLLKRGYMDYHSDRFPDHSLIFTRAGKIFALLPASARDKALVSHPGLTYGGLITNSKATVAEVLEAFFQLKQYLRLNGFLSFIYKPVPYIYHTMPADEDLYALFRIGAVLHSRSVSSTIAQNNRTKFRNIRKAGIRKAVKAGLIIEETSDFAPFWQILNTNLTDRYGVKAVHSLDEIKLLASRFPEEIKLFVAKKENKTLAGMLVYATKNVAHSQYIAASPEGKESGALDLIVDNLVNNVYKHLAFFDFGISTENGGNYLNENLIYQKEGFGGRAVCYDSYELTVASSHGSSIS